MVSFESLNIEELRHILSFLTAKELWVCLGLSRKMRLVANDVVLWKKICISEGVSVDLDETEAASTRNTRQKDTSAQELEVCSFAKKWYLWTAGPVRQWRLPIQHKSNVWSIFRGELSWDAAIVASHGRVAALCPNHGQGDILLFGNVTSPVLRIPPDCVVHEILLTTDYLVAKTVLPSGYIVFRATDHTFKPHMAIKCVKSDLHKATYSYWSESKAQRLNPYPFHITCLYRDKLIAVFVSIVSILNLSTGENKKISLKEVIFYPLFSLDRIILVCSDGIKMYTTNSDLIVSLTKVSPISVCTNNVNLGILQDGGQFHLYSLSNGTYLKSINLNSKNPEFYWFEYLNEVVYSCLWDDELGMHISAVSVESGCTLWIRSVSSVPSLQLVCNNRYIHMSNFNLTNRWHLLDATTGRNIREGPGLVKHVSDYFHIVFNKCNNISKAGYYTVEYHSP